MYHSQNMGVMKTPALQMMQMQKRGILVCNIKQGKRETVQEEEIKLKRLGPSDKYCKYVGKSGFWAENSEMYICKVYLTTCRPKFNDICLEN